MKKVIGLAVCLCAALSTFAVEKETIKSSISEVTVYTQGAQVYRKASYTVKPGVTQLVIEGISPNIDPKSLQVKATGNVVLIDSKYSMFYPQPVEVKLEGLPLKIRKDIQILQDSIADLDYEIREIQDEIDVLTATKSILANNGAIRGQGKVNDSIQLLKQAVDYYQVKMNELNKKMLALNRRKSEKDFKRSGMHARLQDLKNFQSSSAPEQPKGPVHQIMITVSAKEAATGKLTVSYLVSGASWVPMYDLRSDIATGKINLTYKAHVSQNTSEDWDDVRLTVSTNNPYQNKTRPVLHPWYIDYYVAAIYYDQPNYAYSNAPTPQVLSSEAKSNAGAMEDMEIDAQTASDFTTMIDRVLSAEFKIDLPYSIKSDGEEHMVLVKNIDLSANYKYICVPKLDPSAYLVAQIVKLDELQLVPATANIFFDGTYIGETYLDPTTMDDTLSLSLGKDPNIIVKRTLLKKEMKEKIVGNTKERTMSYELEIKNLKSNNIQLIVKDQLPVTQNAEIIIEPIDLDKANYNTVTGILNWEFELKAKENRKIHFSYRVKHDKDKEVILQ
ncbi:MAG TPA: DUF4139 domain-containing protein [Fluviicola sp.]|nr:DUF4139 domain-containing protein [Fluviicola sp.]